MLETFWTFMTDYGWHLLTVTFFSLLMLVGLLMIIVLFFGGFITVGGEWFQMWRSTAWNGLDPAFRNSVLAAITLVLIHTTAQGWVRKVHVENTSSH